MAFSELTHRLILREVSHSTKTTEFLEKLAKEEPNTLACMHGSAWKGDGASLLRKLGTSFLK
jgi:hypothetical protein